MRDEGLTVVVATRTELASRAMAIAWRAEIHEADVVGRLLAAFRTHNGATWPSDNAMLAAVDRIIERPDSEFLLAAPDADSPPVGVCQIRFRPSVWTASDDCWLEDLFVSDDARGQGLGAALTAFAVERARERGCRRIELDTQEDNDPALGLYRKLGFSERAKGESRTLFLQAKLDLT